MLELEPMKEGRSFSLARSHPPHRQDLIKNIDLYKNNIISISGVNFWRAHCEKRIRTSLVTVPESKRKQKAMAIV